MCAEWGLIAIDWLFNKVVPPLLAVGLGAYVFARIMENHRARRDFLSREVQDLRALVTDFWEACRSYWLPDKLSDQKDLEERLVFLQDEIVANLELLGQNFDESFRQSVSRIAEDLAAEATGGDFGDDGRKSDAARVGRIRLAITKLRQQLHLARRSKLHRSGN